jgi:hypothetical protein
MRNILVCGAESPLKANEWFLTKSWNSPPVVETVSLILHNNNNNIL